MKVSTPWQVLVFTGVVFILVRLIFDLLLPLGIALVVVGCIAYLVQTPKTPRIKR